MKRVRLGRPRSSDTVLIASDNTQVRDRCRRALTRSFAVHETSEKASLDYTLRRLKPAVLLLDLKLRGLGRLDSLPSIQRLTPLTKIIVLTNSSKLSEELAALKLGAKGYCKDDMKLESLTKAVRVINQGEIWTGRKVIPNLVEEILALRQVTKRSTPEALVAFDRLTIRKREIARLVAQGLTNKDIARQLHITESTVKAHLSAIFKRFNLSDRVQLAVLMTVGSSL